MVYTGKLDLVFEGSIGAQESITSLEFNRDASAFYVGSDKARVYKVNTVSKQSEGEPVEIEIG